MFGEIGMSVLTLTYCKYQVYTLGWPYFCTDEAHPLTEGTGSSLPQKVPWDESICIK